MFEHVAKRWNSEKRMRIRRCLAGVLIGAMGMVALGHPALEFLHLWRMYSDEKQSILEMASKALQSAYSESMVGMTLALALLGASTGLMVALLTRDRGTSKLHLTLPDDEASLKRLIDTGENEYLEFKSSMRWDWQRGKVNKTLEYVIAKTLCGMMNHRGGILLIGVDDQGRILGIGKDCGTLKRADQDGFEQRLVTLAANHLGGRHARGIQTRFLFCNGETVVIVRVEPRRQPVYCRDGDTHRYYVRTGNSTRELDTREALAHIAEKKRSG